MNLDALDRAILERLQVGFPLTSQPFALLGEELGIGEAEALARVRSLKEAKVIRHIGAIFDARRLGYQSTLGAFHVIDSALERVAARVSAHPGVSHNYARPHHYNLWFTLAAPPGLEVGDEIRRLACRSSVDDWLSLPALRMFKLRTHFGLGINGPSPAADEPDKTGSKNRRFSRADIPYVGALQQDLPLVPRPFAEIAEGQGISEERLLERARDLESAGIMRRFSVALRHRRVGYEANGMACWVVPEPRIEEVGRFAAGYTQVSHCYQRPAHPPLWPYNLFTMIHGQTRHAVESIVASIARRTAIQDYEVLYSIREFKKERVRYFEEER